MAQIFRVERTNNFTVMSNHHFKNMTRSQSFRIIFLFTMACITRSERNTRSSVQRKRRTRTIMYWHWRLSQGNLMGKEWIGQRYTLNESVDFTFRNKEYHFNNGFNYTWSCWKCFGHMDRDWAVQKKYGMIYIKCFSH